MFREFPKRGPPSCNFLLRLERSEAVERFERIEPSAVERLQLLATRCCLTLRAFFY